MTFDEIKKNNQDKRIALFCDHNNGLNLFIGFQSTEWPSDWPSENITDEWIKGLGIDFFKWNGGNNYVNQKGA